MFKPNSLTKHYTSSFLFPPNLGPGKSNHGCGLTVHLLQTFWILDKERQWRFDKKENRICPTTMPIRGLYILSYPIINLWPEIIWCLRTLVCIFAFSWVVLWCVNVRIHICIQVQGRLLLLLNQQLLRV